MSEIMQKLSNLHGLEYGSTNETEEERLERSKKKCELLCESFNKEQGDLDDGYDCPICKNKGFIWKPELHCNSYHEVAVHCKCIPIRRTIRAMKRSGLEDVVHDYTFDKYITTEPWQETVLNTAKRYVDSKENNWFFFGGATGAGKSHICTAIAITLLKRGNEIKYMLWRDETNRLKSIVNEPEYEEQLDFYKNVDVLYIDDLFKTGRSSSDVKQRPTQADINLAFEILNARYIRKKITIISSESTIPDLIDIDEAIAGRIKQKCGEFCININPDRNKNYRLK